MLAARRTATVFPSRPFPLSPRRGEPPTVRRVPFGAPLPLVAAGPVLAPPLLRRHMHPLTERCGENTLGGAWNSIAVC